MIVADHITVQAGERIILQDIAAQINHGEITAILGANGAGKSTLLRCLAGSQAVDRGTIRLDDKDLADYSLRELAIKRAVLSQANTIDFPFSAEEIVMMGRYPYSLGETGESDEAVCLQALERVDALHLRGRTFPTLSDGEQQRVHLARVLAQLWEQSDAYLLLDEPTTALDIKHQHQLFSILKDLAQQKNFAVCIVLHDLNLALRYTDQAILLENGRLFASDETQAVLNSDTIEKVFEVPQEIALPSALTA